MAENEEPQRSEVKLDDASSDDDRTHVSDSEPEQTQVIGKPSPSTPTSLKKTQRQSPQERRKQPTSSSESGSESESDGPDSNYKPIAYKPVAVTTTNGARKPSYKLNASERDSPDKPTALKRPSELKETEAMAAKKPKKSHMLISDSRKVLLQSPPREDGEAMILNGTADYSGRKKSDPAAENFNADVTRTQLQDEIWRAKKKKLKNIRTKETEDKVRNSSKPCEQKAYESFKKVSGNESGKEKLIKRTKAGCSAARKTPTKRDKEAGKKEAKDLKSALEVVTGDQWWLSSDDLTVDERVLMVGEELFEKGKGFEGEKEWQKLRLEEMKVDREQMHVRSDLINLVLDVTEFQDVATD